MALFQFVHDVSLPVAEVVYCGVVCLFPVLVFHLKMYLDNRSAIVNVIGFTREKKKNAKQQHPDVLKRNQTSIFS